MGACTSEDNVTKTHKVDKAALKEAMMTPEKRVVTNQMVNTKKSPEKFPAGKFQIQ